MVHEPRNAGVPGRLRPPILIKSRSMKRVRRSFAADLSTDRDDPHNALDCAHSHLKSVAESEVFFDGVAGLLASPWSRPRERGEIESSKSRASSTSNLWVGCFGAHGRCYHARMNPPFDPRRFRAYEIEFDAGGNRLGCKFLLDDGSLLFIHESEITFENRALMASLGSATGRPAPRRPHTRHGI
jgi:hypothetical protein